MFPSHSFCDSKQVISEKAQHIKRWTLAMQHQTSHKSHLCPIKTKGGHEKRDGRDWVCTLWSSLHKQLAKQDTSVRKGKAEPGKGSDGNQACSIVIYFYSCTGNFSCWQPALASHTLSPFLSRQKRRGAKWDPSVGSATSPPGASSIWNVMFKYLLCFAYGLEISASPSNWGMVVGLSAEMANAGRTVKHIERLDGKTLSFLSMGKSSAEVLCPIWAPHFTDGAKWR